MDYFEFEASKSKVQPIVYTAIRPEVEEYDRVYWRGSSQPVPPFAYHYPNVFAFYERSTLQEYDEEINAQPEFVEPIFTVVPVTDMLDPNHPAFLRAASNPHNLLEYFYDPTPAV